MRNKFVSIGLISITLVCLGVTQSFARCIGAVVNGDCLGTDIQALGDDDNGYVGNSGNTYQYDLSNPTDQLRYSTDLNAQRRDQMNLNTGTTLDRGMGQSGGGIYDE